MKCSARGFLTSVNVSIGYSFIGRYFQLNERGTTFSTELAGATATFLTMAYILAVSCYDISCSNLVHMRVVCDEVGNQHCIEHTHTQVNPRILADSGGPCVPNTEDGGIYGQKYEECLMEINRQYVTATAIGSMFGELGSVA